MNIYRPGWAREAELSDLIVAYDPSTLERQPVPRQPLLDYYARYNNDMAWTIVSRLPERDGFLDNDAVDALLVRVHCELQRVSEEFMHGQRVAELLRPVIDTLRRHEVPPPYRIVEMGCGIGFVIRWLAAYDALGPDVELVGADYNAALVKEATRLAEAETLSCRFEVANAFRMSVPATLYISTGFVHHFRGMALVELFSEHERSEASGFVHFDFQPSILAPIGSWLFHAVRMREPLARHDGVLSAVRAYSAAELMGAARSGCPRFSTAHYGARLWKTPIPRSFHAVVGIHPPYRQTLVEALGSRRSRLGEWS